MRVPFLRHPLARVALVLVGACVNDPARAQHADADGREGLRALASAFAAIESIEVELTPEVPGVPPAARTRVVVHRDGRFAYEEFEHPPSSPPRRRPPTVGLRRPDGSPTGEHLTYYVFHDLTSLFTTDGDARLYFRSRAAGDPLSLPPRPQYDLAPWPVLGTLVEHVLRSTRTAFTSAGHRWSSRTPLPDGHAFELHWELTREFGPILTRVRRDAPDASFVTDLSDFALVDGIALPTRRADDATFLHQGETRRVHSARAVRVVAVNPADLDQRVRFDPEKYSLRYLDLASGNVHVREGGTILFNMREVNAAFDKERAQASLFSRSWFGGTIAAALGSLALLWRKIKGGGP